MSDSDLPLIERFTLFFDFLGTSDATSWEAEQLYPFQDLLIALGGQLPSSQDLDGSAQADGSYKFTIAPEVTTFSDNVVVSYPSLGDETSLPPNIPKHLSFQAHWRNLCARMPSG